MDTTSSTILEDTCTVDRRLDRAIMHINNLWFPINSDLLEDILIGYNDGRYDFGVEFLIEDLKKDLSLYVYCLKELSRLLRSEGISICVKGPKALFEMAGKERIKKVLSVNPHTISQHRSDQLTDFQAKQLAASITSATTAEALAEGSCCPCESAYMTAVLRQLGLLLICWNYPSAYQKALKLQNNERSLDEILSELLGFTPLLIVFRLIKEWGLSTEIEQALQYKDNNQDDDLAKPFTLKENGGVVHYLASLCEVGEALARANQPDIYATALQDWEMARGVIQETLGVDGLQVIAQHAQEYCSAYCKENPELLKILDNLNPEKQIHSYLEKNLLNSNPFAERCPPLAKKLFKEYYRLRAINKDSRQSLSFLFKDVFSSLGFSGGIVYTINAETSHLVVRLHVGGIDPLSLKQLSFRSKHDQGEPAVTALNCSTLVQGQLSGDEDISFIASRLGQTTPIGVLYVELPTSLFHDPELDFTIHLKAFRQALHHAFGLTN